MLYRVTYADGSQEVVDAENISEARETAEDLYDIPIRRVVADESETEELDDDPDDSDNDPDELDEGENPDEEGN